MVTARCSTKAKALFVKRGLSAESDLRVVSRCSESILSRSREGFNGKEKDSDDREMVMRLEFTVAFEKGQIKSALSNSGDQKLVKKV